MDECSNHTAYYHFYFLASVFAEVDVPAFSGQSYFSANISNSDSATSLSISLSLRTRATPGLVLLIPGEGDTFIVLRITNLGTLTLDYRVGDIGTITLNAPLYYISDGLWHSVILVIAANSLSLTVDNRVAHSTAIPSHIDPFSYSIIYIGGAGGVSVPLSVQAIPGLVGCVDRLSTNGQLFQNEFIDGERISECAMGACISTACSGNGVCIEDSSSAQGFSCECNLGYTGAACDQGIVLCSHNYTFMRYSTFTYSDTRLLFMYYIFHLQN